MHGDDGKPQGIWGLGSDGALTGPLNAPIPDGPAGLVPHNLRGLAPLPDGGFLAMNAYIKDTRILRFGAKDANGAYPYLGDFATAGAAVPALAHGYQIAIGPNGNVYASNQDSNTVTCFAGVALPNAGQPVSLANAAGGAPGVIVPSDKTSAEGINDVRGIAFGPDGLLYVCDRGNNRVQIFKASDVGKPCANPNGDVGKCGFVGEIHVAPQTSGGTSGTVNFSSDPRQSCLYIADLGNDVV
ncbi:MAG: hypothetical protein WCI96_11780, partial [Planctomycetota bacterium]